ncbi:MAG: hypothetical protein IJ814_02680 [Paludibacteraceae bacterium]|nr:hypothetical protein [Paludibacteraceae bacterium]
MKKLFAFVAAAFISVAMFASREVVPSDDNLKDYATGTYTMCIYNDGACNGIVLNGTYAGWPNDADHAKLLDFQAVEGFEGWYVVSWNDTTGAETKDGGVQAKPIQLDGSGLFNWDYQLGGDAELIRGTELEGKPVMNPNGSEVDIKNLQPGIYVIDVKSWKNNPCTATYHVYNITLVSPDCNDEDFIVPAISGGFNGWAQQAMTLNELKTAERQNDSLPGGVFEISVKAAEGSEFKFRSSEEWGKDWNNELKEHDEEEDGWKGFSGAGVVEQAENGNLLLGEETDLVFDLGDPEKYSWTNCEKPAEEKEFDYDITVTNAPVCGEAVLAIVGGFEACNWTVADAVEVVAGKATLHAKNSDQFKFLDKSVGNWDNEVQGFDQTTFNAADIADGEEDGKIAIDLDGTYFAACAPEEAIENVVLTEKAQKVVVDGVLYIVRDNKMYNAQGTQVR